jgi:hypothetical protein
MCNKLKLEKSDEKRFGFKIFFVTDDSSVDNKFGTCLVRKSSCQVIVCDNNVIMNAIKQQSSDFHLIFTV